VEILAAYLSRLEAGYELIQKGAFDQIIHRWKALSRTVGQAVAVEELDRRYTGRVEDVDDSGVLLVRDAAGTLHRIFSADIRLIDAGNRQRS
jgi:BirA family biotin operon repressor/biotin-[acetyl-CoA-carboxylase] ligase